MRVAAPIAELSSTNHSLVDAALASMPRGTAGTTISAAKGVTIVLKLSSGPTRGSRLRAATPSPFRDFREVRGQPNSGRFPSAREAFEKWILNPTSTCARIAGGFALPSQGLLKRDEKRRGDLFSCSRADALSRIGKRRTRLHAGFAPTRLGFDLRVLLPARFASHLTPHV